MSKLPLPFAAAVALAVTGALAQAPNSRLHGTVLALDGYVLHLETDREGEVLVSLAPDYIVNALVPASLAEIRPGVYLGAVANPQANGLLTAREVHIFPGNLRGADEGRRPLAAGSQTVVASGTVSDLQSDPSGATLTLTYTGGEAIVVVPPGIPVVRFAPGTRSMLSRGAHVVLRPDSGAGGSVKASSVIVGTDGVVPPI